MKHSQLTDHLQEQATLYAAGAMTDSERLEYARHLEDDRCTVCQAEVDELQGAMSLLAFSAPQAVPSPVVRERLMEQARNAAVRPATSFLRRHWLEFITSAAAVFGIAIAIVATQANAELRRMTDQLTGQISQLQVQLTRARTLINTMTLPEVRVVNLAGKGSNPQASARLFWDVKQKHWYLYVKDLPQVPADKSYELWFVPKAGNPVKAVVFNTPVTGSTEIEVNVPEGIDLNAAAVTTEPAGGTDQPTGPFALLGTM